LDQGLTLVEISEQGAFAVSMLFGLTLASSGLVLTKTSAGTADNPSNAKRTFDDGRSTSQR
jgi:hypothetical protein